MLKNWQGKDYEYYNHWSDILTDREFMQLQDALSLDTWVTTTDLAVENLENNEEAIENYGEPVIKISYKLVGDLKEEYDFLGGSSSFTKIGLYSDDMAFIFTERITLKRGDGPSPGYDYDSETISSIVYQLPPGTFARIHQRLTEIRENKRQELGSNPAAFLQKLLSSKYEVSWTTAYDEPKLYHGKEYDENVYVCLGTRAMAEEIITACGDVGAWEALPPGNYSGRYQNAYPSLSIGSHPYYISIYTGKKGGIYIEVPEYLVFYAPDDDLLPAVHKVLAKYRNQWRMFLDVE